MRCRYCFFDGQHVVPDNQPLLVKLLRPFVQVAFCRSCYTTHLYRGLLLLGKRVPSGSMVPDDRPPEEELGPVPRQIDRPAWLRPKVKTVVGSNSNRFSSRTMKSRAGS